MSNLTEKQMADLLLTVEGLKRSIGCFTRNIIYTERQRNDGLLSSKEWSSEIFKYEEELEAQLAHAKPIIEKRERERIIAFCEDNNVIAFNKKKSLDELGLLLTMEKWQALKEGKL